MTDKLQWIDNADGGGAYAEIGFANKKYVIYGTTWWLHPSFEAPQNAGLWNGDLTPAKEAAQKDYERRMEEAFPEEAPANRPVERYAIPHDGFTGTVIGRYTTLEGKRGVVLQQDGTRVVHVYGEKWLKGLTS